MRSEQLLWRSWLLLSFCRIFTRTTRLVHHKPSNICICYKTLIWPFAPLNRVYVVVAFSDSEIHLHLCTKYLKERELNLSVHITKIGFKLILFGVWRTQDSNYLLARTTAYTHTLHDNGNFGVLFLEYVHCSVSNVIGWLIWTFWSNALQFHIQQTTWHVLALVEVLFLEHLISAPITISLKKAWIF